MKTMTAILPMGRANNTPPTQFKGYHNGAGSA